ncbi:MAG TPA: hypothetical protein VGX92_17420 [Pyrinomonadaceae bacterium]|nr:hypothetical protein [Pyrinomonadaceae bacterium]
MKIYPQPFWAGSLIIEKTIQRASLIGHVVRDVVYENISPSGFQAELVGWGTTPQYKQDGFFIFSGLRAGDYTLKIIGERLQPATIKVVIPAQTHVFLESRGDNELVVIVRQVVNDSEGVGSRKITFDPVVLTKQIRAGARVVSNGLPANSPAKLIATLDAGEVSTARVTNAASLTVNSIVRIIRDRSIRMNQDPYYVFPSSITRVVGKVVSKENTELPLSGAQVRVTRINSAAVTANDIHGVAIFTGVDTSGASIVLGAEKDISALTNEKGDYNLYFSNETLASYMVTDQTLTALDAAGVPQKVLDGLDDPAVKEKVFRGLERFLAAIREAMGREGVSNEVLLKHQPLILQHSEGFIRNLTLEVTLAGFDPASKLEPINTNQRKVVNFELARA